MFWFPDFSHLLLMNKYTGGSKKQPLNWVWPYSMTDAIEFTDDTVKKQVV